MEGALPPGSTRVLLIEDSPADAKSIRALLETQPFDLAHVTRVGAALEHLGRDSIDVVLLDLMLPDVTGLDGLTRVQRAAPDKPILILTHLDDEHTAIRLPKGTYRVRRQREWKSPSAASVTVSD